VSSAPTIGRIVHYRTYENERTAERCVPALVTQVLDRGEESLQFVGLAIHYPSGLMFDREVRHDENQDPATWHWPCVITEEDE